MKPAKITLTLEALNSLLDRTREEAKVGTQARFKEELNALLINLQRRSIDKDEIDIGEFRNLVNDVHISLNSTPSINQFFNPR